MKIGLISDTHGYMDDKIAGYLQDADEIWHAGDIGTLEVANQLKSLKPLRAVHGNIDGKEIRVIYPQDQVFEVEGLKVWMTHIGGYPPRYGKGIKSRLDTVKPNIFICGHSHILKIMPDKARKGLIHINPGAAGQQGFHKVRTLVKMEIGSGKITDLKVVELGLRGRLV